MGFTRGGKGAVLVDDSTGVPVDITEFVDSVEWGGREREVLETTVFGTDTKSFVPGLSDGKLTISGKFDAAANGPDELFHEILGAEVLTTVTWQPAGAGAGKAEYEVEAICNSYTASAPVGEIITYSAGFQMSGSVTRSVQV